MILVVWIKDGSPLRNTNYTYMVLTRLNTNHLDMLNLS